MRIKLFAFPAGVVLLLGLTAAVSHGAVDPLDEPLAPAIQQHIQTCLRSWMNAPMVKPSVPVPGWPVYTGSDWTMQYPANWKVREGNPYYMWVADPTGVCNFLFVQLQQIPGMPSMDQMREMGFQRMAGAAPHRVITTSTKNPMASLGFNDGTGLMQIWYVRWLHPSAGRMISIVQVNLLSRSPLYTAVQWVFNSAPETSLIATDTKVFGPMIGSAYFTIPKGGSSPSDRDGDGYPDHADRFPDDPNRW